MKMMPVVLPIVKINKYDSVTHMVLSSDGCWLFSVAIFGTTKKYIDSYCNVGAKLFLSDWSIDGNKNFVCHKLEIVKNGGKNE